MKQASAAAILLASGLASAAPAKLQTRVVPSSQLDYTPYKNYPTPSWFNAPHEQSAQDGISVPFVFTNNLASSNVKLYFTFQPTDSAGISFIGPDGSVVKPQGTSGNVDLSTIEHSINGGQGSQYNFTLTTGFNSGRVYISDGSMQWPLNPAGQVASPAAETDEGHNYELNWGFIEVNVGTAGDVFGNLSFVDFVGLIIGARLATSSNPNQLVTGMPSDGLSQLCGLLNGAQDWGQLCISNGIRALSPNKAAAPASLATYFDDYINQVFDKYTNEDLIMFNSADNTNHTGRVTNGALVVDGFTWSKPTSADIYSCNDGPFSDPSGNPTAGFIDPILCAAFNRGTLLLDNGNYQPEGPSESTYYTNDVNNLYAKYVHQLEVDHRGYALQYDEPHPSGEAETAGTFQAAAGDPVTALEVSIGAPLS